MMGVIMDFPGRNRLRFPMSPVLISMFVAGCLFFLSCPSVLAADPPVPPSAEWSQVFLDHAAAYSVALAGSHYVVAGGQSSVLWDPYHPPEGLDYWAALAKLDLSGNVVDWETFDDEPDHNIAYSVIPSYSGPDTIDGYVVTGSRHVAFEEDGHNYYTPYVWLMKVTTNLDTMLWQNTFGEPFFHFGNSVIQDDTGFVIGGQKNIGTLSTYAGYMIRTDNSGNLDWEIDGYMFDGGGILYPWIGHGTEIHSIKETSTGDYILGTTSGIIKVNVVSGSPLTHAWTAGDGSYSSVQQTADGGYIGVGSKLVEVAGADDRYDVVLTKLDAGGAVTWSRTFGRLTVGLGGAGLGDRGRDVIQTSDGGYALVGTTQSYAWHGGSDMWLIKTDSGGIMQWDLVLGNEGDDYGRALVEAPDGGFVLVGSMTWEGSMRMWMLKIRPGGFIPPTPSFTYTPDSPFFVEETVHFNATGSTDDNPLDVYDWDFGDDQTGSGSTPDHTYIRPDTYTVTLYVTDDDGVRRETSQDLTAVALAVQWKRSYGDSGDYGWDIVTSGDGGFVIAGQWKWTSTNQDFWVFKTDGQGNVIWDSKFNAGTYSYYRSGALAVTRAHNGGYVAAGYREKMDAYGAKTFDVWIVKVNDDGTMDMDWDDDGTPEGYKYFFTGPDKTEQAYDIEPTGDDGYIIAGYAIREYDPPWTEDTHYRNDMWLIKTDIGGVLDWDETYSPGDLNDHLQGYGVAPTADNGFVVTGNFSRGPYSSGDHRIVTIKTDSGGAEQWRASGTAGDPRKTFGRWVCQTPDLGYVVAGRHNNLAALQKLTPSGGQDWLQTWGESSLPYIQNATKTPDGGFAMVGSHTTDMVNYYDDLYVARTDSEGKIAWEWDYPIDGATENGQSILALPDGSFIILAAQPHVSHGSTLLLKYGPNLVPSGDFTYTPDPPEVGRDVEFTASADDPDGSVVGYIWRFGDGTDPEPTSEGAASHTFAAPGDYTVTLTMVDDDGGENLVSHDFTVVERTTIPGDMDGDGDLDGVDLASFAEAYAEAFGAVEGVDPNYNADVDLNDDGRVDEDDLANFADIWASDGS